jgi:low density lipoprotein-related protein 2
MAVNPVVGMLFWINKPSVRTSGGRGNLGHKIMSASLNGENVKVLVETGLDSPSGLAVDYMSNGRVWWCDNRRSLVESVNWDGTDRMRVRHVAMRDPFKIDLFESHLYWLSEDAGVVNKVDKFGRGARVELIQGLDLVEDLKVFHALKIPTSGN